jgi:hypothetical protein
MISDRSIAELNVFFMKISASLVQCHLSNVVSLIKRYEYRTSGFSS